MAEKIKGGSFLIETLSPEQVFTPEDLNDEQKMIIKTTQEFIEGEVAPHSEAIEKLDLDLTVKLLRKAGELGLLSAEIPEKYGGMGLDKISAALISEYFVRAGSLALSHGAHIGIGSLPIVLFGNKDQKGRYLPLLATGEKLAAYALTEPGSGSDALGAKTTAVLSPDGKYYILNGQKQFITNAGFADIFIVYAKVDGEKFSAFIVERNFKGVTTGPEEKKMGIKGSSTRPLILEDVHVPVENLLYEVGKGHHIAFNILNIGRYKLGIGTMGSSKWAIELAAQYANGRKQFKVPISSFGLIRDKLARMATQTFALESMMYRTSGLIEDALSDVDTEADDAGSKFTTAIADYAIECSINKVFGSETFDFVVDEGVQIHGGYGFIQEYAIEQMYRDSRINRIFEGTNEINRMLIPGTLARKAAKGELPLMQKVMQLQQELTAPIPEAPEGVLGQEQQLLENAKKIFLMLSGLATQKFGNKVEQEQELLAVAADIAIQIFAGESALLRTQKAISRNGEAGEQLKIQYTRLFIQEAFDKIETWAKNGLAAMEEGDVLKTQLAILKKLTKREPVNTLALKRAIAERIVAAEKYVV